MQNKPSLILVRVVLNEIELLLNTLFLLLNYTQQLHAITHFLLYYSQFAKKQFLLFFISIGGGTCVCNNNLFSLNLPMGFTCSHYHF